MAIQPKSSIVELGSWIEEVLKIGALFYAAGFLVILLHTARFNVPVIEALHFQNVLAGWPVGAIAALAYLIRSFMAWPLPSKADSSDQKNWELGLFIVALEVVGFGGLWFVLRFFTLGQSMYLRIVICISALALGNCISFFQARMEGYKTGQSVFRSIAIVLAFFLLAAVYTIWIYPKIPQSFGGGRPSLIQLYFKSPELRSVLGGSSTSEDQTIASDPVFLYYHTSEFLLVSKEENSKEPLVQVPSDQIHAIRWLQSHSKPD